MGRVRAVLTCVLATATWMATAQNGPSGKMLTVDSIMRGPKLVGTAPANVRWSRDSSTVYFTWQKAQDTRASTYAVNRDGTGLRQLSADDARMVDVVPTGARFDRARSRALVAENGDILIIDVATGKRRPITRTSITETNARWARHDRAVTFIREGNLFLLALDAAEPASLVQLTDAVPSDNQTAGAAPAGQRGAGGRGGRGGGTTAQTTQAIGAGETASQRVLREEELQLIEHLKRPVDQPDRAGGPATPPVEPIARVQLGPRQSLADLQLSSDERFVWLGVDERPDAAPRSQDVPNYVTQSAYPEVIPGRPNVGDAQARRLLGVLDLKASKVVWADASTFAGLERKTTPSAPDVARLVDWSMPDCSDDGAQCIVAVRSQDNKDRWLVKVDAVTGRAVVLDNLHDDAWIRELALGGPVTGAGTGGVWLPDNKRFVFLSEKSGWMHLYSMDLTAASPQTKPLTSGPWEVTDARLSQDRQTIFFTSNMVHPGERHFYTMSIDGGSPKQVTAMTGSNDVTVSPDEKMMAVVYSYTIKPPELYLMPLAAGAPARQVTTSPTEEWQAFKWIDPKIITYKTRDGFDVYARLLTPEMIGARRDPRRPAIVFVHGAGYLQEAHKYWSTSYYRENMFNNLLASRGYVVLDPDYRASAGYGRDWRTAIYRHMGGKDLEDVVDGAAFLVRTERVDPKRIGVYGGSYGGFITLMAMFTTPDVFAAGAALRPVTDWSHYNHGYTSNILNVPQTDLEAYRKSSPIYFAEGLKGRLLICHGMVDTNVFFQDTVRLVQRLIELRKENWSVAPYPVENHTFTEETSWADEYRRILSLFEDTLRR
jgi:dipeptidyl aminopeptidase/acylaminoacyl peptidase